MFRLEMGRGVRRRKAEDLLPIATRYLTVDKVPEMRNRIVRVTVDNVPRPIAASNLSGLVTNHKTVVRAHKAPLPMDVSTCSGLGTDHARPNSASFMSNDSHELTPSSNAPWSADRAPLPTAASMGNGFGTGTS